MRRLLSFLAPSLFLVPAVALAVNFTDRGTRYSDNNSLTVAERAAVSVLTNAAAVSGNPDGTFAPDRPVNRAEFLKIALLSAGTDISVPTHDCFPDVKHDQWFASYVCEAKDRGIVEGNPDGLYHPERQVNYAEAVKILVTLHGYSLPLPAPNVRWAWYTGYMLAADSFGVLLPENLSADHPLTRGQTVRLAAAFLAQADGQLDEYRRAERGEAISSSSSSRSVSSRSSQSSSRSSSMSSSSRSSQSSMSSTSRSMDPMADDDVTRDTFVSLGVTTPILAAENAFINEEPLLVTDITIETTGGTLASVDAFLVYNQSGALLGTATRSGSEYTLHLTTGALTIPRSRQTGFYVRARLAPYDRIKTSGEEISINRIVIEGTGEWSNSDYTRALDGDWPVVVTSRERFTEIVSTSTSSAPLLSDSSLSLLKMRMRASNDDPATSLQVQTLVFRISATNATISNPQLSVPGGSSSVSCGIASNIVTCSGLPPSIGTVDTEKQLELRANVQVTGGAQNARVQAFLQNPGTDTSAGDITWTDGTSVFTWVPYESPVVVGTSYVLE